MNQIYLPHQYISNPSIHPTYSTMVKCFLRDNEIFYEYSSYSQCLLPTGLKPIVNSHTELYPSKKVSLKSAKKNLATKILDSFSTSHN